jgi:hypothetical protein
MESKKLLFFSDCLRKINPANMLVMRDVAEVEKFGEVIVSYWGDKEGGQRGMLGKDWMKGGEGRKKARNE